jgi:ATP-dependent DNA ligase
VKIAVRFYSRHGAEYTDRLPATVEAFAALPASSRTFEQLGPTHIGALQ